MLRQPGGPHGRSEPLPVVVLARVVLFASSASQREFPGVTSEWIALLKHVEATIQVLGSLRHGPDSVLDTVCSTFAPA